MGQVTIYLDEETEKKMREFVKSTGLSLSKWLSNLIKEKTSKNWLDFVSSLAGAWTDLPTAEEIRDSLGKDYKRQAI